MRYRALLVLLAGFLQGYLLGQDRPSLTSPVLKTEPETISFTTEISNLAPGSVYRVGVGAPLDIQDAELQISKGGELLTLEPVSFQQGYATAYFELDEIQSQGYLFSSDNLPAPGERLALKMTLPRGEAERLGRLFIFVSKQFGPTTWYILDGAEINNSHW